MKTKLLDTDKANKVYDLLVSIGGANERERDSFIHHHCTNEYGCSEWRFEGLLGFGGKYRNPANIVTCYAENLTDAREKIIKELNEKLKLI